MSVSIFLPLVYLVIGLCIGKAGIDIKGKASALLTKAIIPLVIIFNIATSRHGVVVVMVGTIIMMTIMLLLGRLFTRDPIENLASCYLNIGWLGLPIASALFEEGAAMVIVSAYIGSSLFGNSIGVGLIVNQETFRHRLRQTILTPPVLALLIGVALVPAGDLLHRHLHAEYEVVKFAMGFLGIAILGIWLSETPIKTDDFKEAVKSMAVRASALAVLVTVFIEICGRFDVRLVLENKPTLYLICLLPPAANIVVLETHYLKTGRSASAIACGTFVSILAILAYVAGIMLLRS
jgi:malate permease and related proteins